MTLKKCALVFNYFMARSFQNEKIESSSTVRVGIHRAFRYTNNLKLNLTQIKWYNNTYNHKPIASAFNSVI